MTNALPLFDHSELGDRRPATTAGDEVELTTAPSADRDPECLVRKCVPAMQALVQRSLRTEDGLPSGARTVRVPVAAMRHLNAERGRDWPAATHNDLIRAAVLAHIARTAAEAAIMEPTPRGPKGKRTDLHSVSVVAPLSWWRALNAFCALTGRTQSQVLAEALAPKALRASR